MSLISINNLTFRYDGSLDNVFENVSFNIDTNWKIGLIGRNGKGKTTFLKLLLGEYEYNGRISKSVQLKILLISLFLKGDNFLLIDEPTNHLDIETRNNLTNYLKRKKGFIVVSHDRDFLDKVVDHIISINNTNIDIEQGNFSTWQENKDRQDNFERTQNEKLKKDIDRLEIASQNTAKWSDKVEKTKYNTTNSGSKVDRGYIGHQAAKMMKKSKVMERRIEKAIDEKASLLNNVDRNDSLKIVTLENRKNPLVLAEKLQIKYDDKVIFNPISFEVNDKDRVAIVGKNGAGKSSILNLILGNDIKYDGNIKIANDLKISYVSQSTEGLTGTLKSILMNDDRGTLKSISTDDDVDESIFKAMLVKMGVPNKEFDKDIKQMSEGQKKKVLIAKSISQRANLYIWDEPLNYIDILTRIQIEEAILKYKPALIFVEHDETFIKKIATKTIYLD